MSVIGWNIEWDKIILSLFSSLFLKKAQQLTIHKSTLILLTYEYVIQCTIGQNFQAVNIMPPILSLTVFVTVDKSSPANNPTALMYTEHFTDK
jgi:hypothetical protein